MWGVPVVVCNPCLAWGADVCAVTKVRPSLKLAAISSSRGSFIHSVVCRLFEQRSQDTSSVHCSSKSIKIKQAAALFGRETVALFISLSRATPFFRWRNLVLDARSTVRELSSIITSVLWSLVYVNDSLCSWSQSTEGGGVRIIFHRLSCAVLSRLNLYRHTNRRIRPNAPTGVTIQVKSWQNTGGRCSPEENMKSRCFQNSQPLWFLAVLS